MFSRNLTRRTWLASSAAAGGALLSGGLAAQAADAPLDVAITNQDGTGEHILTELMLRQHYFDEFGLRAEDRLHFRQSADHELPDQRQG